LREVLEETGLTGVCPEPGLFDVDAHEIPERKHEPAHVHYDVRFLVVAPFVPPTVSEESHAVKWVALDAVQALNTDESVLRMVAKTRR